jgi:dihydroorotase
VALETGADADLVLLDPGAEWQVDPAAFYSLGRNTPFAGRTLTGRVLATWVAGRLAHVDESRLGAAAHPAAGAAVARAESR